MNNLLVLGSGLVYANGGFVLGFVLFGNNGGIIGSIIGFAVGVKLWL